MLTLGNSVPNVQLLRPDGSTVRLEDLPKKPLLLIFLRHLA